MLKKHPFGLSYTVNLNQVEPLYGWRTSAAYGNIGFDKSCDGACQSILWPMGNLFSHVRHRTFMQRSVICFSSVQPQQGRLPWHNDVARSDDYSHLNTTLKLCSLAFGASLLRKMDLILVMTDVQSVVSRILITTTVKMIGR